MLFLQTHTPSSGVLFSIRDDADGWHASESFPVIYATYDRRYYEDMREDKIVKCEYKNEMCIDIVV